MYKLTMETATYRERGIGHDTMFSHILKTLEPNVVLFRNLRNRRDLKGSIALRRLIRNHRLNREQPGQ